MDEGTGEESAVADLLTRGALHYSRLDVAAVVLESESGPRVFSCGDTRLPGGMSGRHLVIGAIHIKA